MKQQLGAVVSEARESIARNWALRVAESSERYRHEPLGSIQETCLALVEGLVEVLALDNYEVISGTLTALAIRRASGGFERTEVERALLMGCDAVYPALQAAYADDARALVFSVTQVEKAMHRCLGILSQAVHEVSMAGTDRERLAAQSARQTAEGRLQAILTALGHGALTVNTESVVTWADERAASARCGLRAPGDAFGDDPRDPPGHNIVVEALRTGQVREAPARDECDPWLAVPSRDAEGNVTEVIVILGPPRPAAGA